LPPAHHHIILNAFPSSESAVTEPWVRLTLDHLRKGSASEIRAAQRYCYPLRQVRIVSCEPYTHAECGRECERVVILVPPRLMAIWRAPAPGEWSIEYVAAWHLLSLTEKVLVKAGEMIPF
jgi:hypothetical protein